MPFSPLDEIIRLKPRPETTLALESALKAGAETVKSYRFTPSIRDTFREMLELASSPRGQGYWVEAEYGAGKTHLLATLGVLLTDHTGAAWDAVTDPEIAGYRTAIAKSQLFPVLLNCKGRLATEGSENSLQRVLENAIEVSIENSDLRGKVSVSTADEIIQWWEKAPQGVKSDLEQNIRSRFGGANSEDILSHKGPEAFARAVLQAAEAVRIQVPLTRDVRSRLQHIYQQITSSNKYNGLLVIVDEFKSWQDLHPAGTPGYAEDEHILETIAFHLPVDDHCRILTIVGSQSSPPAKLMGGSEGDRFRRFSLFASERSVREYDEIVAYRVRSILDDHRPEIDEYYNHYFKEFRFLNQTKREYFTDIFPFQPRCFEVIRNITKRELATARSSIHYVHDVLSQPEVLHRQGLVKVADLLASDNLISDLQSAAYKDAYLSYQAGFNALPALFDEDSDRQLAEEVLKTLFLWHCAFPDEPRGVTASELAEACLAEEDEGIKRDDVVHGIILQRLKELTQVEYTNKEKGAFFRVTVSQGPTYTEILQRYQRKVDDDRDAAPCWLELLRATVFKTEGIGMLFADQALDKPERTVARANKIRYDGERVIVRNWSRHLGGEVLDRTDYSLHFRIVYALEPVDLNPAEILDDRIAVVIPASWTVVARDEMRRYCATLRIDEEYDGQTGPEAEEIRQSNKAKKKEILLEIRRKQDQAFRAGKIITRAGLGVDPKVAFADSAKSDEEIASILLTHAYSQPPFNHESFKRELSATEPGRIFNVLFQNSRATADLGAVDNFAQGLGLVSARKPREFDPVHCSLLELIRSELENAKGDLTLYTFYEKYCSAPWGVPVDVLNLALLAFVRLSTPPCSLAIKPEAPLVLKSGVAPRDNRLTFSDVPNTTWVRGKLHRNFERLIQMEGPGWNDFVEYFRVLDPTLQATTAPEQVTTQQERLARSLDEWQKKVQGLRTRLEPFARELRQLITSVTDALSDVEAVCQCDPHHLQTFEHVLAEHFDSDGERLLSAVSIVQRAEQLDRQYLPSLTQALRYIDGIEGLTADDALQAERTTIRKSFDLISFCESPDSAADVLTKFNQFRADYSTRYQQHYRDYRVTIERLHGILDEFEAQISGLTAMDQVSELGQSTGGGLGERRKDLLRQTDPTRLPTGIPDVTERPVVNGVRLDTEAPERLVRRLESDIDVALIARFDLLSATNVREILGTAKEPPVVNLVAAIDADDYKAVGKQFTKEVAQTVRDLLKKAKLVVRDVSLADFGPRQVGDEDLAVTAQAFEKFLREQLGKARREHQDKTVRLNLK